LCPRQREAAPRKRDDDDEAEEEDDGETTSELDAAPAGEKDVSAFENFDMTKFLNGEVRGWALCVFEAGVGAQLPACVRCVVTMRWACCC
jgi:hypothetical protein